VILDRPIASEASATDTPAAHLLLSVGPLPLKRTPADLGWSTSSLTAIVVQEGLNVKSPLNRILFGRPCTEIVQPFTLKVWIVMTKT
jgi:hypothetical protein